MRRSYLRGVLDVYAPYFLTLYRPIRLLSFAPSSLSLFLLSLYLLVIVFEGYELRYILILDLSRYPELG